MNRNDLKDTNPVYISKAQIQEYKEHYRNVLKKSWEPGGFSFIGAACEAENVLTNLFRVPQEDLREISSEVMKEQNESKTNC